MAKGNWILILTAPLIALVFFGEEIAWEIKGAIFERGAVGSGDSALEIDALKAELAKLEAVKNQLPKTNSSYLPVIVLSRYPMNFKNELLVNAGTAYGVRVGNAAILKGLLVGRVAKVFEESSLIETIFDSKFQAPVRIGNFAADALFKGGLTPKIALIPLDAKVGVGDIVYSASADFPYGLALGEIKDIKISEDKLFREAALEFAYDISEAKTILIANSSN